MVRGNIKEGLIAPSPFPAPLSNIQPTCIVGISGAFSGGFTDEASVKANNYIKTSIRSYINVLLL
jgi:hypothetical protein